MNTETVKISELDSITEITDDDILPIVQSGNTKKITTSNLMSGKSNVGHNHDDRYFREIPNSSANVVGGIKTRLDGTTLYITNNGSNA